MNSNASYIHIPNFHIIKHGVLLSLLIPWRRDNLLFDKKLNLTHSFTFDENSHNDTIHLIYNDGGFNSVGYNHFIIVINEHLNSTFINKLSQYLSGHDALTESTSENFLGQLAVCFDIRIILKPFLIYNLHILVYILRLFFMWLISLFV